MMVPGAHVAPGSPERPIQPGRNPSEPSSMFAQTLTRARVVGFSREASWCQAPGCQHAVTTGAAIVREADDSVVHFAPACVRRVLGVPLTHDDLQAIEARRHAAFVMDLAFVHAVFVAAHPVQCARLLRVLEVLAPATVAERVVMEAARARLVAVVEPVVDGELVEFDTP